MIYGKIWGTTQPILKTPLLEIHRITIKKGYRCSRHIHKHKWNGFYVESGILEIHSVKNKYKLTDVTRLVAGAFTAVPPNEEHFFLCVEDCMGIEFYWPEVLSDDIERLDVGQAMAEDNDEKNSPPTDSPLPPGYWKQIGNSGW